MKNIAIIPARMGSSRFPGKPMKPILGKPMIEHVFRRAKACKRLDAVYIATCDEEIRQFIQKIGGQAIMTSSQHERATERTAEALLKIEANLNKKIENVVMLQGDEPLITPKMIEMSIEGLINESAAGVVNLMARISQDEIQNPNEIKVVTDLNGYALYFSREPIPTNKKGGGAQAYKQVCVIPFRRSFLLDYVKWSPTPLEIAESIDMNRVLEMGHKVKMVLCDSVSAAVDVPDDIQKVERFLVHDPLYKIYAQD